jgi:S1-C subfamily serine protease
VSFGFDIIGDLLVGVLWWLIPEEIDRRNDRKRLLVGEVRCSLRAVDRRVLNIGTEWSAGIARVEPGVLRFSPSIGIVGDRVVPVHSIRERPTPNALASGAGPLGGVSGVGTGFIITTTGGELIVNVPTVVAAEVAEILTPEAGGASAHEQGADTPNRPRDVSGRSEPG